jgi:DNA-directed RNA polymerase subunit RPC12/RpoP
MPQIDLFPQTKAPRRRPHILMKLYDAGDSGCAGFSKIALFRCPKCGRKSDWIPIKRNSDATRGILCPSCNPAETVA